MFLVRDDDKRFRDAQYRRELVDTAQSYEIAMLDLNALFVQDEVEVRDADYVLDALHEPGLLTKAVRVPKRMTKASKDALVRYEGALMNARSALDTWLPGVYVDSAVPVDYLEYLRDWDLLRDFWLREIENLGLQPGDYKPWHEAAVHHEGLDWAYDSYRQNFRDGWHNQVRDWYSNLDDGRVYPLEQHPMEWLDYAIGDGEMPFVSKAGREYWLRHRDRSHWPEPEEILLSEWDIEDFTDWVFDQGIDIGEGDPQKIAVAFLVAQGKLPPRDNPRALDPTEGFIRNDKYVPRLVGVYSKVITDLRKEMFR